MSDLPNFAELGRAIETLQAVVAMDLPEPRANKKRVVSKMAKNIQSGDLVDFPAFGQHEVNGWSRSDGIVTVTAGRHLTTFPENERVRVIREVAA